MGQSMATITLVGRLTRDAELKYTNSGDAICHFSIATDTRVKKGDSYIDEPSFWDVDLWGKRGESINQYLTKGKQVAVSGSARIDKWEQDGQPRMKVKVNAADVQMLGSKPEGEGDGRQEAPKAKQGPAVQPVRQSPFGDGGKQPASADGFIDDVPF